MNGIPLYLIAAVLMALVGAACALLAIAWAIPSWRSRLGRRWQTAESLDRSEALHGWAERLGTPIIGIGIAACAVIAWYGAWCAMPE